MANKRAHSSPPHVESSEEEMEDEVEEAEEDEMEEVNPVNPSSEDEDEDEDEDDEKEEANEEDGKAIIAAGSESDSSESDSDSDPPIDVKPIRSKPMSPAVKTSEKTHLFQRVWSLEDEIALLNGILDYKSKTGVIVTQSYGRKLSDFRDFVMKSLSMNATDVQIADKVRRLKTKYERAASRPSLQFATPHDRTKFEISQKIWGEESDAGADKKSAAGNDDYPFIRQAIMAEGYDFAALAALEKLGTTQARSLERKFKKQKIVMMKHHVQKIDLQKETFKLVMDGIEKSK